MSKVNWREFPTVTDADREEVLARNKLGFEDTMYLVKLRCPESYHENTWFTLRGIVRAYLGVDGKFYTFNPLSDNIPDITANDITPFVVAYVPISELV